MASTTNGAAPPVAGEVISQQGSVAAEWTANWTLVLAASVGFSFVTVMIAATGVFTTPLSREFG